MRGHDEFGWGSATSAVPESEEEGASLEDLVVDVVGALFQWKKCFMLGFLLFGARYPDK